MTAALPSVEIVRQTPSATRWHVRFARSGPAQARDYYATTYPNSDLVSLETAVGRRVTKWTGTRIVPLVREAIAAAQAQEITTCAS